MRREAVNKGLCALLAGMESLAEAQARTGEVLVLGVKLADTGLSRRI